MITSEVRESRSRSVQLNSRNDHAENVLKSPEAARPKLKSNVLSVKSPEAARLNLKVRSIIQKHSQVNECSMQTLLAQSQGCGPFEN